MRSFLVATLAAIAVAQDQVSFDRCRDDQDADWCAYFCDNQQALPYLSQAQADVACVWQDAPNLDPTQISYDMCLGQMNYDWCTYACIAARDRDDFMYTNTGLTDFACMNELIYEGTREFYTWEMCRNDQKAYVCQDMCDSGYWDKALTDEQVRVACVWANAPNLDVIDIYRYGCIEAGDPDWCTYACIDARDNGNSWYWEDEIEIACASERWYDGPEAEPVDDGIEDEMVDAATFDIDDIDPEVAPAGDDFEETAGGLGIADIFYTHCRHDGDPDACEQVCNSNFYPEPETEEACTWTACATYNDVGACERICDSESYNEDITRKACKWQHASLEWDDVLTLYNGLYCHMNGDQDWCEWLCAFDENPSFADSRPRYFPYDYEQTCAELGQAKVSLAAKGVQAESSNAACYVAGASLVSAAAVIYLVMRRKDEKAIETPLLTVDDQFKAQM